MTSRSTHELRILLTTLTLAFSLLPTLAVIGESLGAPAFQESPTLPEAARQAWEATVFLKTRAPGHGVSTGTGVILHQDTAAQNLKIATAAHVVPCDAGCVVRVFFPKRSGRGRVSTVAHLVWTDAGQDVALLTAPVPENARFQVAPTARATGAGAPVVAIGFPDLFLRAGEHGKRGKRFSTGLFLEAAADFAADYHAYGSRAAAGRLRPAAALLHTADLLPGSSGGPLIDGEGRVIAVNSGSLALGDEQRCVVRGTANGGRCVHLAIALDDLIDQIDGRRDPRVKRSASEY